MLAVQLSETLWVGAAVPVPERLAVAVLGDALLLTVNVAFWAPAVDGLKVIVNGTLEPALMVTGSERPPTVKTPELLVVAALTVTLAPVAVSVPEVDPLSPTITLPRLRLEGVMVSVPVALTPVP